MPRTKKGTDPKYRRHSSGQARVTVRDQHGNRRDIMLGPWDSTKSWVAYRETLATIDVHGHYPFKDQEDTQEDLTVDELILAWWTATERRLGPDSKELRQYKSGLKFLRQLFGKTPASKFTPKHLKAVRQAMIDTGWCRTVINRNIVRVRAVFSWGVSDVLIPPSVSHGLKEVKGLKPGEYRVKESPPKAPATWEDVKKVLPYCTPPVAALLQLQCLTGMRSGEVRVIRTIDIDRTDPNCWTYRPGSDAGPFGRHKNAWREQIRVVALGPQCIELLTPWINDKNPEAYLFQTWYGKRNADPKVIKRRKRRGQKARKAGKCYSDTAYPLSVARACKQAGVHFTPYALRHGRKMAVAREYGSDAARAVLGQKSIEATQHYGELDQAHAKKVMTAIG